MTFAADGFAGLIDHPDGATAPIPSIQETLAAPTDPQRNKATMTGISVLPFIVLPFPRKFPSYLPQFGEPFTPYLATLRPHDVRPARTELRPIGRNSIPGAYWEYLTRILATLRAGTQGKKAGPTLFNSRNPAGNWVFSPWQMRNSPSWQYASTRFNLCTYDCSSVRLHLAVGLRDRR